MEAEATMDSDGTLRCLDIDWEDDSGENVKSRTLVGRIVAEKALNRNTAKAMIVKAWNMQKGLSILEVSENHFRFSFDKEEDCVRILKGRPWLILGCVLVLERWQPTLTLGEVSLTSSPYWVQLHDLPLEGFSMKNLIKIGGVLVMFWLLKIHS